jgi:hypothetical protein
MTSINRLTSTALLLVGTVSLAALPTASCTARVSGRRILVDVELGSLFDPDLLRLVRLGLKGHLTVELKVLKPRPLWFDALVAQDDATFSVDYSRERGALVLEGRREVPDPGHLALERLSVRLDSPPEGPHQVQIHAKLQVVTASSLGEVARWLAGRARDRKEERPDALSRNLLDGVATELARSASARCEVAR